LSTIIDINLSFIYPQYSYEGVLAGLPQYPMIIAKDSERKGACLFIEESKFLIKNKSLF
jgi:hypothetical protein